MMHLEMFITEVYCLVDDFVKGQQSLPGWTRQRGPAPQHSHSDVLTMEVVGEFLGYDTEKGTWQYFATPPPRDVSQLKLPNEFHPASGDLWAYKRALQHRLARKRRSPTGGAIVQSLDRERGGPEQP